jgi:hypothetical protein
VVERPPPTLHGEKIELKKASSAAIAIGSALGSGDSSG